MSGIAQAIKKAAEDADYRASLMADPKAALGEIGVSVKADIELVVVENTANRVHLVLPPPGTDLSELSEEDLGTWLAGAFTRT